MDEINVSAIAGLTTAIQQLLTAGLQNGTALPPIAIAPLKVSPVGLGGFVASHPDPQQATGEIMGRRVEATVSVTVQGNRTADLAEEGATVTQALLGSTRADREQQGILRLEYRDRSDGDRMPLERELMFWVLYEFLQVPTEATETIATIPTTIAIGSG